MNILLSGKRKTHLMQHEFLYLYGNESSARGKKNCLKQHLFLYHHNYRCLFSLRYIDYIIIILSSFLSYSFLFTLSLPSVFFFLFSSPSSLIDLIINIKFIQCPPEDQGSAKVWNFGTRTPGPVICDDVTDSLT